MFNLLVKAFVIFGFVKIAQGCSGNGRMIKAGGLTQVERQEIVDAHNRLRQSVALGQVSSQPPAANMMEMHWDDELAATAQRWSEQCRTAHDRRNDRNVGRFPVGQNIAATWTTREPTDAVDYVPDFSKQIKAWFDEVRAYGFKPADYAHGTGHYSQLVWGETSHVGCGFSFYYDPSRGYTKLYVCNYGPGGNVIGSNPYDRGSPACNNYGLTDSAKYSGLCSASYSTSSSYNSAPLDNSGNYAANVIPGNGDAPSAYDAYSYSNSYKRSYNQFNNQNQYSGGNYGNNAAPTSNSYPGNSQYNQVIGYGGYKPSASSFPEQTSQSADTYKPFVSLFKDAANLLKPKANIFGENRIFSTKGTGFKFGTFFLRR